MRQQVLWSRRLRLDRTDGESERDVLRGLGCGAHLAYANADAWNVAVPRYDSRKGMRARLERDWGVTTRAEWTEVERRLLDGEMGTPAWDLVLEVREGLDSSGGHQVPEHAWQHGIAHALPERTEPADTDLPALTTSLGTLTTRIPRYETRFREDGVLGPGQRVRTCLAWDIGRAANMTYWGSTAGFAQPVEVRSALRRAGELAAENYGSWAEFSAAYVLGRCLHFDNDTFGPWYLTARDAHRVLTTHAKSPWTMLTLR